MDIVTHKFHGMNYSFTPLAETPIIDHGIHGGESDTVLFKPEKVVTSESVILVPGIGINTNTVEGNFTMIAQEISQKLMMRVAIALEGKWNNKTTSGFPETGITFAIRNTISDIGSTNGIHIIAFSHNSTNTLIACAMSDIYPSIKSITLIAPTDSPFSIVKVFKAANKQVTEIGTETFVGSRNTHLQAILKPNPNNHHSELFNKKLRASVLSLQSKGIPISILHGGSSDGIVPVDMSKSFAESINLQLEVVEPKSIDNKTNSIVHDFATPNQLEFLINKLKKVIK